MNKILQYLMDGFAAHASLTNPCPLTGEEANAADATQSQNGKQPQGAEQPQQPGRSEIFPIVMM